MGRLIEDRTYTLPRGTEDHALKANLSLSDNTAIEEKRMSRSGGEPYWTPSKVSASLDNITSTARWSALRRRDEGVRHENAGLLKHFLEFLDLPVVLNSELSE
jgi:hypothetical protein